MLQPHCSLTTEIQEICPIRLSQLWVVALCNKSSAQKAARAGKTCQRGILAAHSSEGQALISQGRFSRDIPGAPPCLEKEL